MPWFAIVPVLPILFAYLAGAVVALALALRYRSIPAVLALIGFLILAVMVLFNLFRAPVLEFLVRKGPFRGPVAAHVGLGCCCSVVDVAAIALLIVALWQAISGKTAA
ncbi:MAG: hypothetical protein N2508_07055 [Anaerolineae bacterium]|nr:hypothetical protein [Anaerolineae bacterium]